MKHDRRLGHDRIRWRVPLGLFLGSFFLSAAFALWARPLPVTDEFLTYFKIAQNISFGKGFTEDGTTPYLYLPPLFSSLLGGWFFLTGYRTLLSVQLYQSLCIALSVVFTFFLVREIYPRGKASRAAAIWLAIHPSLWTYAVFVRQEPTLLLFTTLSSWLTILWFRRPGRGRAALAGGIWGLTTLAKVVTIFVPGLLVLFWALRRERDGKVPPTEVLVAAAAFFLVIAPWTTRNYMHFQRFIPVNEQAKGMVEWNIQHSDAPVEEGKGNVALLLSLLRTKEATHGNLAGEKFLAELNRQGVQGKERNERLWEYILMHKRYFLIQRIRNAIFFASPGVDWWIQSGRLKTGGALDSPAFWLFALVYHAPFYGFLVWRLAHLIRGDLPSAVSFFVLFFLCYWGEYSLLWGENRFSIPVYPLLVLFAPWERTGTKR